MGDFGNSTYRTHSFHLGLSRLIRQPDPPEEPTGPNPNPADPTAPPGRWRVFTSPNRFWWVGFGFPPQKSEKPELIDWFPDFGKFSRFRQIFQIPAKIFQNPAKIFQNPVNKPRFWRYFALDPVRFWLDLEKSNQIRRDFCRILGKSHRNLENYRRNLCLFAGSVFFHRFLVVFSDLWLRPTRPTPVDGLNRPTRLLRRVGGGCIFSSPDSGGSVSGWAQTLPEPTCGQPYSWYKKEI